MPRKLNMFKQDILNLVKSVEPQTLFWREVHARLKPIHAANYKDEKVFGVVLTQNLTWLKSKGLIKQVGDKIGTPKAHFNLEEIKYTKDEKTPFWKKQFRERRNHILNAIANQDPDDLTRVPEATILILKCGDFPSEIKGKVEPKVNRLDRLIKWAFHPEMSPFFTRRVIINRRLQGIAKKIVPEIFEEVSTLLHES